MVNSKRVCFFLFPVILFLALNACSSMQTYSSFQDAQTIVKNQSYQVRVRTGNEVMDKLIYEFAYLEFGKYLPIAEQGSFTGTVDIIFASSSESAFVGSSAGYATTIGYVNGWYTGTGYVGATGTASTVSSGISSGGTFTWQNSTMLVILKDSEGRRLWSADYKYKGGWEMSGWSVNTPQEAARLCVQRVAEKLKQDLTSGNNNR
jgi:hypothetical protein